MLEDTDEEPFNTVGEYLLVDMSQWKCCEEFDRWSLNVDAESDEHEKGEEVFMKHEANKSGRKQS
jgi:hypothetical protein